MVLSSGATSGVADSGLIVNRGSDSNVGFIWDESGNHFAAINTTEEGTTSGDVTVSSYADIKANKILLGSSELTENIVSSLSGITLGTAAASKLQSYLRTTDSNSQIDVDNKFSLKQESFIWELATVQLDITKVHIIFCIRIE